MLLEGGKRLLASYPETLSHDAKEALRRLGVDVRLETLVTEVAPDYVRAAGWTIPTHTVIWAAGNTASPILGTLGAPLDRQGRVVVEPDTTIPGHPEVFVIGDAANFTHDEHGTLPGIAPVAIQMGQYVARTIESDLAERPRTAFHYWDKGQLAVIGRGKAVADIWRLHFSGVFAWLTWIFVHILYLIGFRNRILVLLQWAWSYATYGLGARLIPEEYHPNDALARSGEGAGDATGIPGLRRHRPEPEPARR